MLDKVAELFDKRCYLDLLVEDSFATTQTAVHVVHAALRRCRLCLGISTFFRLAQRSHHNSGIT